VTEIKQSWLEQASDYSEEEPKKKRTAMIVLTMNGRESLITGVIGSIWAVVGGMGAERGGGRVSGSAREKDDGFIVGE
jgi:hypothetical protein